MKILVTGATGFIGSWLAETLVDDGAEVTVFVLPNDPVRFQSIKHLTGKVRVVEGDLRNPTSIQEAVNGKDVIFHLAAETQVTRTLANPRGALEVNTVGTFNLLEAIRDANKEAFVIYASTDKVYGEPLYLPIDENHQLNPKSPYEATKLAAERLLMAYHHTYDLRCSVLRWSNTIGGRDSNYLRIIPGIIYPLMRRQAPVIRGDGNDVRDYMYVKDVVRSLLSVLANRERANGRVFNVGTGKPTSVIDLVNTLLDVLELKGKVAPVILKQDTQAEIRVQYLSAEKISRELGFSVRYGLEASIRATVNWYRTNPWWESVIERSRTYYS